MGKILKVDFCAKKLITTDHGLSSGSESLKESAVLAEFYDPILIELALNYKLQKLQKRILENRNKLHSLLTLDMEPEVDSKLDHKYYLELMEACDLALSDFKRK